MEKRTTDHVKYATTKFFEDQGLVHTLDYFFEGATVRQKISEGYQKYQELLAESKLNVSGEAEAYADELETKFGMTKEAFEQDVFETFKEKFCEIMLPAAAFISIKVQLIDLLENQEDNNLLMLLESAMDDITDYMTNRFANIVRLLCEGIPMEIAEEIADEAGDDRVVPIGVKVCFGVDDDDDGDDDDDDDHDSSHQCCNGECGGHCDCKENGKCNETGHCQCEDGCNCDHDTDK